MKSYDGYCWLLYGSHDRHILGLVFGGRGTRHANIVDSGLMSPTFSCIKSSERMWGRSQETQRKIVSDVTDVSLSVSLSLVFPSL